MNSPPNEAMEFLQSKITSGPKTAKQILTDKVKQTAAQVITNPIRTEAPPSLPADAPKTPTPLDTTPPPAPVITNAQADSIDDLERALMPLEYLQPDKPPTDPTPPPVEPTTPPPAPEDDETAFTAEELISKDSKVRTQANYRKTLKERNEEIAAKTAALEEAQERIRLFETGEVVPEPLQRLTQRVAELETYEQIYNVKGTPEYEQEVGGPLASKQERLYKHASEYGIPPEVIDRAFDIDGEKGLNEFLMDNFHDTLGATEAKQLLTDIADLRIKDAEFDTKPKEALQRLQERTQSIKAQKEAIRRTGISRTAKSSWDTSFQQIQEEGLAEELIFRPDDPAHNEKFAKPLVTAAITDYTKTVKLLADAGLPELPPNLATFLANMVLKAHSSAVAIQSRKNALDHADEMERHARRSNTINRPGIGATRPLSPSPTPPQRDNLKPSNEKIRDAADGLLSNVLNKK
jgi:hypothetical protein